MNMQLRMMQHLVSQGINPASATKEQYDKAAIEIRSTREKARDFGSRVKSQARVGILRKEVPLEVLKHREAGCKLNTCGSYQVLDDGTEVCHRCSCSGKNLRLKRRDPRQKCPANPPVWDEHEGD